MHSLNGFYVEVECAGLWVCADSGISGICERTRLFVAQSGYIIFVSAKMIVLVVHSGARGEKSALKQCDDI